MDKNAYSALKTDKNKQITFQLTSGKIDGKTIRCVGSLTIAGTTKQIDVEATYTILSRRLNPMQRIKEARHERLQRRTSFIHVRNSHYWK